jgi:hypothetical protein
MSIHDKVIEKIASEMYDSKLPYHNFGHAMTVTRYSEEVIDKCKREGVALDENVVYYALLFHDAGYHEDHRAKGYETKEAYSANLAQQALRDYGIDEETIKKVESAILCTHMDARCQSNEDKAVRASDLSGFTAEYGIFKLNSVRLWEEQELMHGKSIDWDDWILGVKDTLELFLREELELTSDYYNKGGNSVFHIQTRENIETLLADKTPDL